MELLSIVWVSGVLVWFARTSTRDRENHLLLMWGLLSLPAIYWLTRLLFL